MIEIDAPRRAATRVRNWRFVDRFGLWALRGQRSGVILWLVLGLALSVGITALINQFIDSSYSRYFIALFLLLDFILLMVLAAFLFVTIVRLVGHRRGAGATQRRLITIFVMMALVPTVLVAVFSALILNFGIADWFSTQVRDAVDNSYDTAQAYYNEHNSQLLRDGFAVRDEMQDFYANAPNQSVGDVVQALANASQDRTDIAYSFVIDGTGDIIARGAHSYGFNFIKPSADDLQRLINRDNVVIQDWPQNEFRMVTPIDGKLDRYVYVARRVDGDILALLDQTEATAQFYRDTETSRQRLIVIYGLVFAGVALVILLMAIFAAIFFANRITHPISQLVRGVGRISDGDLSVRVPVSNDDDEFATLSSNFNTMTAEIAKSQSALVEAKETSERERERFNAVLEGVSSGVIGVDAENNLTFINPAARRILAIPDDVNPRNVGMVAPEFLPTIDRLRDGSEMVAQDNLAIIRNGDQDNLLLRAARRAVGADGLILSFDDVSDLVQAQRLAAWGDVARRIAHEIKNPLTPIRLSAERMQRRYGREIDDEKFSELTKIIIRQTDDLRNIVDEFSRFSRMPTLRPEPHDWVAVIRESIALNGEHDNVEIRYDGLDTAMGVFDPALMHQALTNLLKNAVEASQAQTQDGEKGIIAVATERVDGKILRISITDDGAGFPEDKSKLFEPYVTTKEQGTGLGLPIVKKIIEDHGGQLYLRNRSDGKRGALVEIDIELQ